MEYDGAIIDRLMVCIMEADIDCDLQTLKSRFQLVLSEYDIREKETSLVVYTEGKNEIFLKRFLLAKAISGRQERTLEQYRNEIGKALRVIGKDADTITSTDIQLFLGSILKRGASKSYCDTVRRYLCTFFNFLIKEELIDKNPMNKIDNIKFHREKETAFTDLEIETMRENCRDYRERAIIDMLLSTGCRASELVSIKREDVKDGQIKIIGKGGKYRTVYMNAKATVSLNAFLSERKDKNPYVFPGGDFKESKRPGWYRNPKSVSPTEHYSKDSVNATVRKVGERSGVENSHAHRFRRTCATMALRHGMPIEMVSMMLGHSQISTTQIYLDIQESELENCHKKYVV